MEKIDLKTQYKALLTAPVEPAVIDVPELSYLMVDGAGDPNTSAAYRDAIGVLYGLSFTLKFMLKKSEGLDYPVMPLEGLWWMPDGLAFGPANKDKFQWTAMIVQPEFITPERFEKAKAELAARKDPPGLDRARLEKFREGLCVYVMHLGPYAAEAATIANLHQFAAEKGYRLRGKHHEIYLSDPNRTKPERLKTILRQPVAKG